MAGICMQPAMNTPWFSRQWLNDQEMIQAWVMRARYHTH
ncbi:hypothetical protein F941_00177 [Acinetobacter bouvetii DSM 14964 = CIP 107468]|jgi:hypothetical protein|uniref:Uncharacterized protein n=1 Tax=Acinetobacter bouvetii DSM 14964 = CIP 107468 TaxID=1120925 RepID=N9CFH9_9GAMM|nr:hypothetical protein F941_00177 [Acinetobacter bouvetii DSM 14964 = CIP 107468]